MVSQKMNLFTLAFALFLVAQATANPVPLTNRRDDQPPKLSDTLAVAKSPFEPVTLANQRPDARNDGRQPVETTVALELHEERKLTTRSADYDEQQKSSSTKGLDESTGLHDTVPAGSTQSLATEKPEEPASPAEATTTTEPVTEAETKANESEKDDPTTTTTTTTQAPIEASGNEAKPSEAPVPALPTTQEPTTTTSTTEAPTTTTTTTPESKEPETPTTFAPSIDRNEEVAPTTTATQNLSSSTAEPPTSDQKEAPVETASTNTTTTSQPETEPPTTHTELQREQNPSITAITTTTTVAPEATTATRKAEVESSTNLPPAPVETTPKPAGSSQKDEKSSCDHLPTYNSDEVQKVFREETTFKNGTIKGKFTYINFDQRYRLVHYTRLPYGPVKIDKVEELGRPKQTNDNNHSSTPTLNEVPNAVLQLRNLLPNSMFGFPFLGPNTGHLQPREGDDDRSGMYFYSTDSLATPNLLSPRVPVSLLPGQRVKPAESGAGSIHSADNLAHSYTEQAAGKLFGMPTQSETKSLDKPGESPILGQNPAYNRFQYSNSLAVGQAPHEPATNSFPYSYFGSQPYPIQYQYSSLSTPTHFHQPRPVFGLSTEPHLLSFNGQSPLAHHQAHQPHSHEHYMTQYMLNQPQSIAEGGAPLNEPSALTNENPRLRLRVKTSKSLNLNQGTKSAQMRLQSSDGHSSAPISSPAQAFRNQPHQQQQQQRRSGKQSHQLKSAPTNRSPVVYHVLRTPTGRVYNQGYAIAYDQ